MEKIIKNYLKKSHYFQEDNKKSQIVLHHTVSTGWKSPFKWWSRIGNHVCTAYIIDKDGSIYECFNPKYWAYHTGLGSKFDKYNIGIEIVNEGHLNCIDEDKGKFKWFDGKYKYKYKIGGEPVKLTKKWRGYNYFAKYTENQIKSTFELVNKLCNDFNIEKMIAPKHIFNKNFKNFKGIISHANVSKIKTDISPLFPIEKLDEYLEEHKVSIPNLEDPTLIISDLKKENTLTKYHLKVKKTNWIKSLVDIIFNFFIIKKK